MNMLNNSCEVLKDIPANDLDDAWSDSSIVMSFDHVNINTKYLKKTIEFYEILGFIVGPRPKFSFNGAWLYLDHNINLMHSSYSQTAYIHLVEVSAGTFTFSSGTIDHIAFRCDVSLFKETQNILDDHKISYKYNRVILREGNKKNLRNVSAPHQWSLARRGRGTRRNLCAPIRRRASHTIDQLFIYDPNEIKVELNFRK